MGNYRFRLSDMMPNAWFYKLRDMNRARNHHATVVTAAGVSTKKANQKKKPISPNVTNHTQTQIKIQPNLQIYPRKSYYFTRELAEQSEAKLLNSPSRAKSTDDPFGVEPPRRSSKQRRIKRRGAKSGGGKLVTSSVSAGCNCRATIWKTELDCDDEFRSDGTLVPDSFDQLVSKTTTKDIVIDSISDLHLPPIITKPVKTPEPISKPTITQKQSVKKQSNVKQSMSPGVKLRVNSPKIGTKKMMIQGRRSTSSSSSSSSRRSNLSDSFAVVKSSFDPQRDFRESMVEMIVENNIKASKDLEELLACYLSLNSDEYHDLIIKVFKQIWFDLTQVQFK